MNKWLPSRIAASCLYLSRKMLAQPTPWTKDMQAVTQLSEKNVRESAMDICQLINLAHKKGSYEPIFKKYSTSRFMKVAEKPVEIRQKAQKSRESESKTKG